MMKKRCHNVATQEEGGGGSIHRDTQEGEGRAKGEGKPKRSGAEISQAG